MSRLRSAGSPARSCSRRWQRPNMRILRAPRPKGLKDTRTQSIKLQGTETEMTEENSKEERGVKHGTRPGTGQLAVPWHPSASAGRTRWPNPELRCFRRSPRSGAGVCGGDCVCDEHQARHVPHVLAHYFSEVFSSPWFSPSPARCTLYSFSLIKYRSYSVSRGTGSRASLTNRPQSPLAPRSRHPITVITRPARTRHPSVTRPRPGRPGPVSSRS